jgi:hypothetical protein
MINMAIDQDSGHMSCSVALLNKASMHCFRAYTVSRQHPEVRAHEKTAPLSPRRTGAVESAIRRGMDLQHSSVHN